MKTNIQILIGCILYVIGINLFLAPAGIFTTGLMGMAQETTETINQIFALGHQNNDKIFIFYQTLVYWTLNIPILIFSFIKIGKKFTIKTFIVSSVVMQILFNVINTPLILISDNGVQNLASDIVSVLVGSILIGIGLGLIIKKHASAGGTDIIAVYLSLYRGKSFGLQNLLINLIIVVWSVFLTKDLTSGILILISLYIQSYVIDIVYNYNEKITMTIFTTKSEEIGTKILEKGRTFTHLDGHSGFNKKDLAVMVMVINAEEVQEFQKIILRIDKDAFSTTLKTENVQGNFKNLYSKEL